MVLLHTPLFISYNPLICLFTLMGLTQSVLTLEKRNLILSSSRGTAAKPANPACFIHLQWEILHQAFFFPNANKITEKFVLWCYFLTLCCAHFNLRLLRFNKKYRQFARAATDSCSFIQHLSTLPGLRSRLVALETSI